MQGRHFAVGKLPRLAAAILVCGVLLAGCDERITTFRDTTIPIPKHSTWAWRPMPVIPAKTANPGDGRKVLSRDVIVAEPQPNAPVQEPDAATAVVRQQARTAIEQELAHKGFTQISDPQAADFLVDYRMAVQHRDVTVLKGYSGYGGPVCGPYGCWNTWGYGPTQTNYENVRFREGTFVFDFLKRNTLQLAYRGQGQQPAHKGNFSQDDVQEMMHNLLSKLKGQ